MKYLIYGLIGMVLMFSSIGLNSISVAFPHIMSSFDTSVVLAGWVLTIGQLVGTITMPIIGKAGDIFGRKTIFLFALSMFTVGSVLCALAPSIQTLIAFRAIQAMGVAGLMPVSMGIVTDYFPNARQQAIGFFTSISPIGQIIGPNLGGWIVQNYGWRMIFWINVPLGIIAFIVALFLLRRGSREKAQLDLAGVGLLAGSLFSLMVGISEVGDQRLGIPVYIIAIYFIVSILMMVLFILRERRVVNPVIDLSLLSQRPFLASNLYNFIFGVYALGMLSLIPLFGVSVYSLSTLQSGLIITPSSLGMILMSTVTSLNLVRWGYRRPILFGTLASMVAYLLLGAQFKEVSIGGFQIDNMAILFGILAINGLGLGAAAPAANNACIELMPDRVATIIGIRGMFRQFGSALGVSLATLVLHNTSSIAAGFRFVHWGIFTVMLLVIPFIFLMPRSCRVIKE